MKHKMGKPERVGTKIRALRTARGLSLYQLAQRTGLQYHTLQRLEEGETDPRVDTLLKVARVIDTSPAQFFETVRPTTPLKPTLISLPLFRDSASLGSGREINEKDVETYLTVPKSQVPNAEHCRCVKVTGDSMEPVFVSGDIVAVDFSQNDPSSLDRSFVACRLEDGEVTVKQLRIKAKHFHLKGTNPEWEDSHGPLLMLKKDGVVLGKVVWLWRRF